jgi:hypothetical protein
MSHFDFPRINFHGKAILNTATANNGRLKPVIHIFNQDKSKVYMPPRVYLPPPDQGNCDCPLPAGATIKKDKKGNSYVAIFPINDDNYQEWATTPLGSYAADASFSDFYKCIGNCWKNPVIGLLPGYWNYYGDLSMSLQDVLVAGITLPDNNNKPITYSASNSLECPASLLPLLDAELSFNSDFFTPESRTTACMSDVDSMGQMCTQIFCSRVGLYKRDGNVTFFRGTPVKSTARWMNLSRVVNWSDPSLTPMGGSASFYSMIQLSEGNMIAQLLAPYTGAKVTALFMKILVHEVYEVRNPDYGKISSPMLTGVANQQVAVPMNPAIVSISGSITPWFEGDMKTTSICRVLTTPTMKFSIDTSKMHAPTPVGGGDQPLSIPKSVFLGTALLKINDKKKLITLDLSNMCNEYGTGFGNMPPFAGRGDVPPFVSFSNYDYGNISLMYQPDSGAGSLLVGTITYEDDYNMSRFLESGGMVDLPASQMDYSDGYFYLEIDGIKALAENSVFITTDQQGIYAEQRGEEYMSDGLPKGPLVLRVFNRGAPVSRTKPQMITLQNISLTTGSLQNANKVTVYDSMWFILPTDKDGCFTYSFVADPSQLYPLPNANDLDTVTYFAMQSYLVVLRVLSAEKKLLRYLDGKLPITWDVVFKQVLQLYKTIYPVMDKILPIDEQNWSDPITQENVLVLTSELNWHKPNYMPVTRDASGPQIKLLQMWINQTEKPKIV